MLLEDHLKVLACCPEALGILTSYVNACWKSKEVPGEWHEAYVTAIFKKGAPEDCDNYRPISLLCVAYKVYATILLRRLQSAGAEARLSDTEPG